MSQKTPENSLKSDQIYSVECESAILLLYCSHHSIDVKIEES